MRRVAVALGVLGLLLGCTPTPTVTTPEPTFACTPEAGGTPKPCSQTEHEAMVKKDALYTEAQALYRRYFAEEVRLDQLGGAKGATPEFEATLAETLLEQTVAIHQSNYEEHLSARGTQRLEWIERRPGVSLRGSLVAIAACRDASHVKTYRSGTYVGTGYVGVETAFAKYFDGQLRLFTVTTKDVESCAG